MCLPIYFSSTCMYMCLRESKATSAAAWYFTAIFSPREEFAYERFTVGVVERFTWGLGARSISLQSLAPGSKLWYTIGRDLLDVYDVIGRAL